MQIRLERRNAQAVLRRLAISSRMEATHSKLSRLFYDDNVADSSVGTVTAEPVVVGRFGSAGDGRRVVEEVVVGEANGPSRDTRAGAAVGKHAVRGVNLAAGVGANAAVGSRDTREQGVANRDERIGGGINPAAQGVEAAIVDLGRGKPGARGHQDARAYVIEKAILHPQAG